jgi:hypothetical protein
MGCLWRFPVLFIPTVKRHLEGVGIFKKKRL